MPHEESGGPEIGIDDPDPDGVLIHFNRSFDAELFGAIGPVFFNGFGADTEFLSNLDRGVSLGQQEKHLLLPFKRGVRSP